MADHNSLASLIKERAASSASSALVNGIISRLQGKSSSSPTTIHLERFSPDSKSLVTLAQSLSDSLQHQKTEPLHLLFRLIEQPEMESIFQQLKVNTGELALAVKDALEKLPKNAGKDLAYLSPSMISFLERAEKNAGNSSVTLDHLLASLTHEIKPPTGNVLQQFNLLPGVFSPVSPTLKTLTFKSTSTAGSFIRDLVAAARNKELNTVVGRDMETRRLLQILSRSSKNHPLVVGEPGVGKTTIIHGIAQRMANDEVPPNLTNMAFIDLDLNALMAGTKSRTEVEERLKQTISNYQREDSKVILVVEGLENLVGQSSLTSIMDFFKTLLKKDRLQIFATTTPDGIRKINEKDAGFIRNFTLLTVEPPTSDQAVEMLRSVASRFEVHHNVRVSDPAIREAVKLAKRYIQDKALPDSAVDILDEASARRRVEMTGLPADLDRDIQRLSSLKMQQHKLLNDNDPMGQRSLEKINTEIMELEPKVEALRNKIDRRKKVVSTRDDVIAAYEKASKELDDARVMENYAKMGELEHKVLPDLKEKLEKVEKYYAETQSEKNDDVDVVTENDVAQVVSEQTAIPVAKMLESETNKLMNMESRIEKRVVGQNEAVVAVSKAVRRSRAGLRDIRKPIGSFLFLGPSGVGKTELAKAVAEFLFDDETAMTRIDCSELMEKHQSARLIGSPIHEGSQDGGQLTEAIKKRPYSVLLLDEAEKAHPDIFNLFLQILDEGSLSDARGMKVDFSNTVVVLTSNIGSRRILDADPSVFESEEGRDALKSVLWDELTNHLRPEFLNRIDDVVVFRSLSKQHLRSIVDIEVRKIEKLMVDREYKIVLTEQAKDALVDLSYEPVYGARPLKRTLMKRLQDPMSESILSNGYQQGATISVDINDEGQFLFR